MKETYLIAIDRPGMFDLPELCRADSPESAAALVRALLECHDPQLYRVRVEISRIVMQAAAVS